MLERATAARQVVYSAVTQPKVASKVHCIKWSPQFKHWLALLVMINLAARLPLCWDPLTVDNDGAEYLAIARHLRLQGSYATDLKWQFYTDDGVQHSAWADRPPLFPVLAVAFQMALPWVSPTSAARLGNALLACLALVLCAAFLRRVYDEKTALIATGFVFLLPHTLKWTTQPMTETVTLALGFGALAIWVSIDWKDARFSRPFQDPAIIQAFVIGILTGLAYLARPTGAILAIAFVADTIRGSSTRKGATIWAIGLGFLLCALPYHGWLWRLYGNPLHSALGFTFAVETYYEVSYYGYGQSPPTVMGFLAGHWGSLPRLVLHQIWRHVQIVVPQLLPFLPFAAVKSNEKARDFWVGGALTVGLFVVHTLTWSAWGSSRYFLLSLPILVAWLVWRAQTMDAGARPSWLRRYQHAFMPLAWAGLLGSLVNFYLVAARADRGMALLPTWRDAASKVVGARLIASDKPSILNLLLECPAVRLPRTTDVRLLQRFTDEYSPDVMVLFVDEPAEAPMAAAWRRHQMPAGWHLEVDRKDLLIARPVLTGRDLAE